MCDISDFIEKFKKLELEKNPNAIVSKLGHAVGYIRVSTKMQAIDGKSLDNQKIRIQEYCKEKNLILDDIYEDKGESGTKRDRKSLNKMLDSLYPDMKVLIYDIDRASRKLKDFLEIKELVHSKGCSIYVINKNLDTKNQTDEFILNIFSAWAEQEGVGIRDRIVKNMDTLAREGKLRTKPRFGYMIKDNEMIEDPQEQIVINAIKHLIDKDPKITVSAIVRELTKGGFKIRKCNKIYAQSIKNIINDNNLRP